MMSSKLRMATLSSELRVFKLVVFTIPFRAATISGPFILLGIPELSSFHLHLPLFIENTVFCQDSTELQYSVCRKK